MRIHTSSALIVGLLLISACGGGGSTSPTPPVTTPAPQTTVVVQGSGPLLAGFAAVVPFSTNATGRLEVVLDWTFASNDLDIGIFRGACSVQQFNAGQCVAIASAESTINKPERLTIPDFPPGSYTLGLGNFGPGSEGYSYQVTLTR
jgi:hypothetical protein